MSQNVLSMMQRRINLWNLLYQGADFKIFGAIRMSGF